MLATQAETLERSSSFEKGWRNHAPIYRGNNENIFITEGNTVIKFTRNSSPLLHIDWNARANSILRAKGLQSINASPILNKWSVKGVDILSADQRFELDRLNHTLSQYKLIFAEVSRRQNTCVALELGYGIRVRISVYGGDFSSYYISYFEGDDIIFQDHLDFANMIKSIRSVVAELQRAALLNT